MSVFALTWNPDTQRWEHNPEATRLAQLAGWETLDDVPADDIPLGTAYGEDDDDD
ncbi:MAG: hypothetical protein ACXWQR_24340 [Ktedonobacterales bacterium]